MIFSFLLLDCNPRQKSLPIGFLQEIYKNTRFVPFVEAPVFSPASGNYSSPQTITLSSVTSGATIYYTTDGTTPTTSSKLYSTSIGHIYTLAGLTIKAIAIKEGLRNSSVTQANFTYLPMSTRQTTCWDSAGSSVSCSGTGQDGQYQIGLTENYIDNGDGTIADKATNLTWQKCTFGQTPASNCSGGSATTATWDTAVSSCSSLSLNGLQWRLPKLQEAITTVTLNGGGSPLGTPTVFSNTTTNYWTSTVNSLDSMQARGISFNANNIYNALAKSSSFVFRCVSGTSANAQSFTDNGNGTIKDNNTGLTWQKCSGGQNNDTTCSGTATTYTWANALTYCNSLSLLGKTWRLPNRNELLSVTDFDITTTAPTINQTIFPNTQTSASYWVSTTTLPSSPSNAFSILLSTGNSGGANLKTSSLFFARCVTGP